MNRTLIGGIGAAALALALAGCASADGSGSATAGPSPSAAGTAPARPSPPAQPSSAGADARASLAELPMPSASDPVLAVGTVLDAGTPVLCSNVLTSLPPQCSGPAIIGWDWSAVQHEEASGVRWADGVALRATYDAAAFSITPVEPPLELASIALPAREIPTGALDEATIAALQDDLLTLQRPDVLGHGGEDGTLVLDVVYDDGSIQAGIDDIYGPGVVHVQSWFVD